MKEKRHIVIYFLLLGLLIQCKEKDNEFIVKSRKKIIVFAENINENFVGKNETRLIIYSDSSYFCESIISHINYEKQEKFKGRLQLKKDTIEFFSRFKLINSNKAVIKNNFIEFVDGDSDFKIEIKNSLLNIKSKLNLVRYQDYAFFSFNEEFQKPINYGYKPKTIKPYDLEQSELFQIDTILKKCFTENKEKLRKKENYIFQCIAVLNQNQEKEVWVSCYCKNNDRKENYKDRLIDMCDGGNCNVHLKVNLTKNDYTELNIAGF